MVELRGAPTPAEARRVFYLLTLTRWVPTGLVVGLFVLWGLEIGLSGAQAMTALSVIGLTVALLELPTSGFTDVIGRRPVYLVAAVLQVVAALAYLIADGWARFLVAGVLMGAFRALDSGPLEAWFVDTVHLHAPGADVDRPLARAGMIIGAGMSVGSLASGVLVWWHPFASRPALELPMGLYAVLGVAHLAAAAVLIREGPHLTADAATPAQAEAVAHEGTAWRRARASVLATPAVIRSGLGLLGTSAALRGLVAAVSLTSVVMVVQESLMPLRLAELLGDLDSAGALMGPVAAAAWGAFSAGSAAVGMLGERVGVARAAVLARAAHCLAALIMGLVAGPATLVAAYLLTYGVFGGGAMDRALMHREASSSNRATVLSIASMASFLSFAVASPLLGLLAERVSIAGAMVLASVVGLLALPCYLPAARAEARRAPGRAVVG